MGEKKPTTRTLPTGEKITHHPDGREVLQPTNTLAGLLNATAEQQEAEGAALQERLVEAATSKREEMGSGDPVPSDKRVV